MTRPKTFRKSNHGKKIMACKRSTASLAIGELAKDIDIFILTYGQFSLIDALVAILDQTGPAHVTISTWTAAHAPLDRSAELLAAARILSFRMIVDRSFKTRQPKYFDHMCALFGADSIRSINTHAKFMTIRNGAWDIVVRTSMNLNQNPRLENLEISENAEFADFFDRIADDIFAEVPVDKRLINSPSLNSIPDNPQFSLVTGDHIKLDRLKEPNFTHEIRDNGECQAASA